jgi:hypothetical protein
MGYERGGGGFEGHFCGVAEYEIQQVCELIRVSWTNITF